MTDTEAMNTWPPPSDDGLAVIPRWLDDPDAALQPDEEFLVYIGNTTIAGADDDYNLKQALDLAGLILSADQRKPRTETAMTTTEPEPVDFLTALIGEPFAPLGGFRGDVGNNPIRDRLNLIQTERERNALLPTYTHEYDTHKIAVEDLDDIHILVGESGGLSAVYGPGSVVLGCMAVPTEHGDLYFNVGEEVDVMEDPEGHWR